MIELMSFSCISEEVSNSDSLSNDDIYYVDVEDLLDDGGCGLRSKKVPVDPIVSLLIEPQEMEKWP